MKIFQLWIKKDDVWTMKGFYLNKEEASEARFESPYDDYEVIKVKRGGA